MNPSWMDRFGGVASTACVLHCLALSFAPAALTLLGLGVLANETFEWGFFSLALLFAIPAAALGYRAHRTWWVPVGFMVGILVLLAGRFGEAFGLFEGVGLLSILGGALLVASHTASVWRTRLHKEACCE